LQLGSEKKEEKKRLFYFVSFFFSFFGIESVKQRESNSTIRYSPQENFVVLYEYYNYEK
jgi:hypothetical protein